MIVITANVTGGLACNSYSETYSYSISGLELELELELVYAMPYMLKMKRTKYQTFEQRNKFDRYWKDSYGTRFSSSFSTSLIFLKTASSDSSSYARKCIAAAVSL